MSNGDDNIRTMSHFSRFHIEKAIFTSPFDCAKDICNPLCFFETTAGSVSNKYDKPKAQISASIQIMKNSLFIFLFAWFPRITCIGRELIPFAQSNEIGRV